ncbi:MAG: hypothetical protein ACQESR_00700 [Planctomycetota bacterium]
MSRIKCDAGQRQGDGGHARDHQRNDECQKDRENRNQVQADSPETAPYTSGFQRIQARGQGKNARDRADGWMAELTVQPENTATHALADTSHTGRRASDMGIVPMSLNSYRRLLDWTARLIHSGERSTIPKDLAAILDHMNVE